MIIKKFIAKDFQGALKQAKKEMGSDAIILHTSKLRRGGILSFLFAPQVEITVAVDEKLQVNSDRLRKPVSSPVVATEANGPESSLQDRDPGEKTRAQTAPGELLQELQTMKNLMKEVKNKISEVEQIKGISQEVQPFYETLLNNQVDKELALSIISRVESRLPRDSKGDDELWVRDLCLHTVQEYIKEIRPIDLPWDRKGVLVFMVGPTGVGKTTTIAKLAANMSFLKGKDVALITLDTYRVSAAQQLRTFAEIIGIPISVVFNPQDLGAAIHHYQEKDVIFV
ncbi:MAG: flagellar biosynthesis protein FlhF, partial [Syntrophomonas sp.]|nr:flagellar biosynthesis protein FlhF [Syntrophomonas sp.]